jgi:hypothetical protein
MIGTGVRCNGLWYINQEESALIATIEGTYKEIMLLHCRVGHVSFESFGQVVS